MTNLFNRAFLIRKTNALFTVFFLAATLFIAGCEKSAPEEVRIVSKRMKIELPGDEHASKTEHKTEAAVDKKVPAKKKVAAKPKSTAKKPKVRWIKPEKKATTTAVRRKKKAPVRTASVAKKAPVVRKASVAKTAPKTASTSKETRPDSAKPFVINVASFTNKEKAETIMRKLQVMDFNTYVTQANVKGTDWYRVRVGFFDNMEAAKSAEAELIPRYIRGGTWITRPLWAEIDKYNK